MKEDPTAYGEFPTGIRVLPPGRSSQRILVAVEDADLRQMYTDVLAGRGFHADGAGDGAAAWVALNNVCYDLLITENRLPRQTGIRLLENLHTACMSLQVILISDAHLKADLCPRPWLSYDAILLQPHNSEELLATVQQAFLVRGGSQLRTASRFTSRQ